MTVLNASLDITKQLKDLLSELPEEKYKEPIPVLSMSTIGQHVRHVIECFTCFTEGYTQGTINYDKRKREQTLETLLPAALLELQKIEQQLLNIDLSKPLTLQVCFDPSGKSEAVGTTASRELTYNIEHAIHHMALIKIGIKQCSPPISLPENFGIAYSTFYHQQNLCVR